MLSEAELLECERTVASVLARARGRMRTAVDIATPATDLMLREEMAALERAPEELAKEFEDEPRQMMVELLRRIFDFCYEDGPHPKHVTRRFYLLAYRFFPQLVWEMNLTDVGDLFGLTRASESLRMNLIYDRLAACGARGSRGATAKSQESRAEFAALAKGNHNRSKRSLKKK